MYFLHLKNSNLKTSFGTNEERLIDKNLHLVDVLSVLHFRYDVCCKHFAPQKLFYFEF